MQQTHTVVSTERPAQFTLGVMAKTAQAAADTPAIREWASRLAADATVDRPRDYKAMLRRLYDEILQRWRYVPESEEWIHGTPSSLIGTVLGTRYTQPDTPPERAELGATPIKPQGWGDCDDISTVVAAVVRAIGMRPAFRVARNAGGGAHVSVLARTPDGELVSIDPVGHPRHPFGWAVPADHVEVFPLDQAAGLSGVDTMAAQGTTYTDHVGRPMGTQRRTHWVATFPSDARGPRALALPQREAALFRRGIVLDGCPATDEHGNEHTYDADRDLWIDDRLMATNLGMVDESMGGVGRRRRQRRRAARRKKRRARRSSPARAKRKSRRQTRRARRRRIVKRIAKRVRPIAAKLMNSRIARRAVSTALMAVGAPPQLTRGVMAAAGQLLEKGGIPALVRTIRKDPRAAARLVAQAAKAGAMTAANPLGADLQRPTAYMLEQDGRRFAAAPVMALAGVPGLYSLGQLEVTTAPTPGQWYRIQRGDSLLSIAERGWGTRTNRLTRSKWINNANANAAFLRPPDTDFERNQYPDGVISFRPNYASDPVAASRGEAGDRYAVIWIPEAAGDEPPVVEAEGDDPLPVEPVEPETTPDQVVPELPPADAELDIASVPTPGQWYRIQRGDNLLTVAQRAWGSRAGRLQKSQWIAAAVANAATRRPPANAFERTNYPGGLPIFNPKFSSDPLAASRGTPGNSYAVIWIPEAPGDEPGDEPPVIPDDVEPDDVEPDDVEPDDVEPDDVEPDDVEPDDVEPDDVEPDDVEGVCPDDMVWDGQLKTCIPTKPAMCPPGQRWDAGLRDCVPIDELDPDDEVTPDTCPPDFSWDPAMNMCIPTKPTMCPPGQTWDAGSRTCVTDDLDPDGEVTPDVEPDDGGTGDPSSGQLPMIGRLLIGAVLLDVI